MVQQRAKLFQLQDLVCVKCKNVSLASDSSGAEQRRQAAVGRIEMSMSSLLSASWAGIMELDACSRNVATWRQHQKPAFSCRCSKGTSCVSVGFAVAH